MGEACPLVVTISRQRGCGGAYLGQELARSLGIAYLDRALVAEIAKRLEMPMDMVDANDERLATTWESLLATVSSSCTWFYTAPPIHPPSDQVRELESDTIMKIAYEKPVVIVGRGSGYLLRDHPHHVNVFLHAAKPFRVARIREVYNLSEHDASRMIDKVDGLREEYNKAISGLSMYDATQYDITVDTGALGLDKSVKLVTEYVRQRFGDCLNTTGETLTFRLRAKV